MKKMLFVLGLFISCGVSAQHGTVKGVVTYFYNEYQGDKADIGANVLAIDSTQFQDFDYEMIKRYKEGVFYRNLYFSYMEIIAQDEMLIEIFGKKKKDKEKLEKQLIMKKDNELRRDSYYEKMVKCGVETQEKYKELDSNVFSNIMETRNKKVNGEVVINHDIPKETINATGSYSMDLAPGVYYILITSKNRRISHSMSENMGKIYLTKVIIEEGKTIDISHNFNL